MDDETLIAHVRDRRQEIFALRFRNATGELENTAGLRAARRDLARALTIARQRDLPLDQAPSRVMSAEDQEKTDVEETPEAEAEQTPVVERARRAPRQRSPRPRTEPAAEAGARRPRQPSPRPPRSPRKPAEPEAALSPKEARRRARSTHSGHAGEPRDAQQRQADRDARRRERAQPSQRLPHAALAHARPSAARPSPRSRRWSPIRQSSGQPKLRQGVVVSDRPDKTIVVRVDLTRRHRRYGKTVRASSTLHVHDESNDARAGDTVRVLESRPLSKTKRWRLVEVVERAR